MEKESWDKGFPLGGKLSPQAADEGKKGVFLGINHDVQQKIVCYIFLR